MKTENDLPTEKICAINFPVTCHTREEKFETAGNSGSGRQFEIGLCLDGQGILFIENRMIPFTRGNIAIIPPGTPHFVQCPDAHPSRWLLISFDVSAVPFPSVNIASDVVYDPPAENLIRLIAGEINAKENGFEKASLALLDVLFIRFERLSGEASLFFSCSNIHSPVYPAIEYINRHYPDDIDVDTLAANCSMSLTHFRRKFSSVTGMTPLRYLLALRLRMAGVLLRFTDRKISDIALEAGYNTLSSFNRHFKENYSVSPREFRASFRKNDNLL